MTIKQIKQLAIKSGCKKYNNFDIEIPTCNGYYFGFLDGFNANLNNGDIFVKWDLILQKDLGKNITYDRNVLIEILNDFKYIQHIHCRKCNALIINDIGDSLCAECWSKT